MVACAKDFGELSTAIVHSCEELTFASDQSRMICRILALRALLQSLQVKFCSKDPNADLRTPTLRSGHNEADLVSPRLVI